MFGRRAGLFSALAAVMLLLGGCGNAGANLGGTMDGYNNGYGNGRYANGGAATGTATASTAAEAWIMVRIIPPTAHEMTAPALLLGRIWRTPGMTLTGQDRKTKDKDSKVGSKTENNTNRVVD